MQEFSSVTASSYDADSLAPLLSEKAAAGWSVVSIVSAGTNIVAYLSREADDAPAATTTTEEAAGGAEAAVQETESVPAETPAEQPLAATGAAAAASAVDEPAGWASAPEETATAEPAATAETAATAEPAADDSIASLAEQVGAESTQAAAEPETPAAAAEPAVPAGWYADPSGRFELRYWDGTAWTEHVSRAGQQFTDPPVA
jgi:hypothetical protein